MKHSALIAGDLVVLLAVTIIGFASHGEFAPAFIPRMAASFIPLCIGWFLLAPSLGLFQDETTRLASELWRPTFVMLFAGPLAAVLRGLLLQAPVMPSFAVVISVTAAIGLTLWQFVWSMLRHAAH